MVTSGGGLSWRRPARLSASGRARCRERCGCSAGSGWGPRCELRADQKFVQNLGRVPSPEDCGYQGEVVVAGDVVGLLPDVEVKFLVPKSSSWSYISLSRGPGFRLVPRPALIEIGHYHGYSTWVPPLWPQCVNSKVRSRVPRKSLSRSSKVPLHETLVKCFIILFGG